MASDKPTYPSDAADKFIVRFPPGMRERIAESAKANGRSMNAEAVARLDASFNQTSANTAPYRLVLLLAQRWIDNAEVRAIIKELLDEDPSGPQANDFTYFVRMLEVSGQLVKLPDDSVLRPDGQELKRVNYEVIQPDGTKLPVRMTYLPDADYTGLPKGLKVDLQSDHPKISASDGPHSSTINKSRKRKP